MNCAFGGNKYMYDEMNERKAELFSCTDRPTVYERVSQLTCIHYIQVSGTNISVSCNESNRMNRSNRSNRIEE